MGSGQRGWGSGGVGSIGVGQQGWGLGWVGWWGGVGVRVVWGSM